MHKLLLTIALALLLSAGAAFNIHAQVRPPGPPGPRPTPQPTATPAPTSVPPLRTQDKIRQGGKTQFLLAPGIFGRIRWKKEYGMVPIGAGNNTASPIPCGQHFVAALKTVNDGTSFGKLEVVNSTPNLPNKIVSVTEAGDYYVCSYIIPSLPTNTKLLVMAGMGGTLLLPELDPYPLYHTLPWIGGSQPEPPPGYERVFIGSKTVTLTDAAPRATVDFEMVYRPLPATPR